MFSENDIMLTMARKMKDKKPIVNPALNFDWFLCRPGEAGGEMLDSKTICSPVSEGTDCGCRNCGGGVKNLFECKFILRNRMIRLFIFMPRSSTLFTTSRLLV